MYLSDAKDIARFRQRFQPYLGKKWEELIQEMVGKGPAFGLDTRWKNCANWWGNGLNRHPMELDIVAESPDGDTLLVGEAKLTVSPQERPVFEEELKRKAANLPMAKAYRHTVTKLFVAADYDLNP